jgi:hypothetical protein
MSHLSLKTAIYPRKKIGLLTTQLATVICLMSMTLLALEPTAWAEKNCGDEEVNQFLKQVFTTPLLQGRPGLIDFQKIVKRIESGELKLRRVPGQSVSEVMGLPPDQGVFVRQNFIKDWKPGLGLDTHGFEIIHRQKRDVQFFKLSRHLDYDMIPETVLTKINGEEVSMMPKVYGLEFKNEKEYGRFIKRRMIEGKIGYLEHKQDLEDLALLDLVGGNMDRNITNVIFDEKRNRLIGIDHADVMPVQNKLSGVIWFWTMEGPGLNQPMMSETIEKIMKLNPNQLAAKVAQDGLVEEKAIKLMKSRIYFMKNFIKTHPEASMMELGEAMENFLVW